MGAACGHPVPRGRMGSVGRAPVQGWVLLHSAREQICRLDLQLPAALFGGSGMGSHACGAASKGAVGSVCPAAVPQDEARLLLPLQMFRPLGR